jgi:hypothetical protein
MNNSTYKHLRAPTCSINFFLQKVVRNLTSITKEIEEELKRIKQTKTNEILKRLKESTPVDTGKARDGWHVNGDTIVNNVDYIDDLNRGSSVQAPAYFIESAVLSVKDVSPNGVILQPLPNT